MTRYVFDKHTVGAHKSVACTVCGKKVRRQRTFMATDNPWNVNEDGTRRSVPEIYDRLREKAAAWRDEPETHPKCAALVEKP